MKSICAPYNAGMRLRLLFLVHLSNSRGNFVRIVLCAGFSRCPQLPCQKFPDYFPLS